MTDRNNTSKPVNRRRVLKMTGLATSALTIPGVTTAQSNSSSTATPTSSPEGDEPEITEEERREIKEKQKALEKQIREDSERVYQERHRKMMDAQRSGSGGPSTQDIVSSSTVPDLDCGGSVGIQQANWVNSNSSTWAQVGSWSNSYTQQSGLTNKAFAVTDAVAGDDLWAWAETGLVFDAKGTGRVKGTSQGFVRGQNYLKGCGAGYADAKLDYYLLGYNLTDGKVVDGPTNGTQTIEKFGVGVAGFPKNRNKSYSQSLEFDVEAGKRYLFVAKVYSTALAIGCWQAISDSDDKYEAVLDPADWNGYHQMYNMGLSWQSCR
ncbi:hypothetical protein ACFO0N_15080 [Halobium salinum]|uniref:Uncharacterized protein n=1 Tax=Halobium salinum TaxID=1364940 RepID=A0ABD5PEW3_9EURY|nr:hypothetical protein [Halobium salinum]